MRREAVLLGGEALRIAFDLSCSEPGTSAAYAADLARALVAEEPRYSWFFFGAARNIPAGGRPLTLESVKSCDVQVFHYPVFFSRYLGFEPCIVGVHDVLFLTRSHEYADSTRRKMEDALNRALRSARILAVPSVASMKDLVKLTGVSEASVRVIPLAPRKAFRKIDPVLARSWVKRELGLSGDFLLMVGAEYPRKNLWGVIEAMIAITRKRRGVKLLVVGTSKSRRQKARGYAESIGLDPQCLAFLDLVTDEQLVMLYNASAALVYVSFKEGFGLPPLEAFACGIPVVCSRKPAMTEVLKDAAAYVEPERPDDIADACLRVLEDTNFAKAKARAGQELVKQYTWEKAARTVLQIYRDMLA